MDSKKSDWNKLDDFYYVMLLIFFQIFVISWGTEILIEWNFSLVIYVSYMLKQFVMRCLCNLWGNVAKLLRVVFKNSELFYFESQMNFDHSNYRVA